MFLHSIRFFILFLLFSSSVFGKFDLAICAIFQDEAPYLKEWIEFHKMQGVEHFYLYNNHSQDDYLAVLNPYIQKKEVTLVEWPYTYEYGDWEHWIRIQTGSYMHCIKENGSKTKWLAAIDTDEFLFCPSGKKIPKFLKNFTKYGGVCVNWLKFGTSNVEEIPKGSLQIEVFTHHLNPQHFDNFWIKSIVQPKHVLDCVSPHYFIYKPGKFSVDTEKEMLPQNKKNSSRTLVDKLRINHYWTRDEKYLREHKMPSRQKRRTQFTDDMMLEMARTYNEFHNTEILQFVPRLHQAMQMAN